MIKPADSDLIKFCERDVFGTRISAYYRCYSLNYDFVKFWIQTDENSNITAALSRIDGDATLCVNDEADFAELAEFIKAVGFATLQCESGAAKKLNFTAETEGCVVRYVENKIPQKAVNLKNNFELREIYDIIKAENLVGVGDYLPWLSDTSFRINRGVTKPLLAEVEGRGVCTATVLFETEKAALLGGVATVPEFRGRGLAGAVVTLLAEEEKANGKRVELLCKKDSIVNFYKKLGFEVQNEWSIITA
jgi:GNAT superfamily N-acetyltransferase